MTTPRASKGLDPADVTAMVMAAGYGTRMRPLTDTRPKPLVEFAGRALIDHALDRLCEAGIDRAVVNIHYLGDQIRHHLAARMRPSVTLSDESEALLDTGGGAAKVLGTLGPSAFLVINSDAVWRDAGASLLARLLADWRGDLMDGLIALVPPGRAIGYDGPGDFVCGPDYRLTRLRPGAAGAPPAADGLVNIGAYLMHPRLFAGCPEGAFSMNLLWDKAIATGRLYGIVHDGVWMHLGTPDALVDAEAYLTRAGQ